MRYSAILATIYFLAASNQAWAYLDPGTGAIIVQALVASAATGLFVIRSKIAWLASLFKGKNATASEQDPED